ncbi:uncharacterized protein LOC105421544 isoform X2 [Amborella trichopoda]|uniref:uncharacterized protein LOC105421544 isoform X2 n=1 Tax=Amborella trichopoda TaxID=13333 RepID=UPI0005D34987|nr:uncharacterized protein LOC105421544 isoform X2 [Amborella trichopoda]|eukprot:XP_011627621.1 uncharacterized protein LOC105421544 isoform X2 [Amborella trichopoda]
MRFSSSLATLRPQQGITRPSSHLGPNGYLVDGGISKNALQIRNIRSAFGIGQDWSGSDQLVRSGLLFLYWVTNFVVPNLVMPQANTNQTQEDSPPPVQESSQDNSAPTSSQTIKTTSNKSRSKKRRSKSSKRSELMIETQFPKFKSHH